MKLEDFGVLTAIGFFFGLLFMEFSVYIFRKDFLRGMSLGKISKHLYYKFFYVDQKFNKFEKVLIISGLLIIILIIIGIVGSVFVIL